MIITGDFTDDEITVCVQDTGMGIPEDSLPRLFQKFYRVREHEGKTSGTGLGLSICKQIVQGHNGRIEVKSKMGVGTSFTVFLPRSGRSFTEEQMGTIKACLLKAYRWQYIFSGVEHPRFQKLLRSLITEAQVQRIAQALSPLAALQ